MTNQMNPVKRSLARNANFDQELIVSLTLTPIIHEDNHAYKFDNETDELTSENNIIEKVFMDTIFTERVHRVAYQKARANSEFLAAEEIANELFSQLKEALPSDEQKELLLELEEAWGIMNTIFLECSYCQGVADSPMMHNQLKDYGFRIKEDISYDFT